MPRLALLDTFPEFEAYWRTARSRPIDEQIDLWEEEYLAPWPELATKQKQDYADQGLDWRKVARTRVFPYLPERLSRMRRIREELLRTLPQSWARTQRVLGLKVPVVFVIHIGIGCGAGWATRYGGRPACLIGLENAAEHTAGPGWQRPGLVPHEVAHLAQDEWRREQGLAGIATGRGPYWQLYEEGFATEVERRVVGPAVFRQRTGRPDWLEWCEAHRGWLARKFLRDVQARRSVRSFFGSWYPLRGQIECGYWLGAEVVRQLRRGTTWQKVATIPRAASRKLTRDLLREFARGSTDGMIPVRPPRVGGRATS